MNFEKSCVSFSTNLSNYDKQLLTDCLGVKRVDFHDRDLGLPVLVRKSKKETFSYVKRRLWKKLQSSRGGLLSCAGRELLVKTVAQALPMYYMQCFLLPKFFCEELNTMIAKFWWSSDPGKLKIHWLNWRQLCKPKLEEVWDSEISLRLTLHYWRTQAWRFIQISRLLCFQRLILPDHRLSQCSG